MSLDQIDIEKHEAQMSFLEHLEELRWHIIRSLVAISIGTVISFYYGTYIFDTILLGPTQADFWTFRKICELSDLIYHSDKICVDKMEFVIKTMKVQEQFFQHMMIAIMGGFVLVLPYILYEIYRFIKPALRAKEKKYSGLAILSASFLFFLGVLFGYFFLAPISINFLGNYTLSEVIQKEFTVASVVSLITLLTIGSGIMFELPLVIYFLAKIGLVTAATLRSYRKVAIVIILIVAAIITPPDVASQILLAIPLMVLYEVGIFIAQRVEPKLDDI